jgi:hypothetical protein
MARQVIDGLTCDTTTAKFLDNVGSDDEIGYGDLDYFSAALYQAPEGHYFIVGEGGARTLFARPDGSMSAPGRGIRLIDEDTALNLLGEDFEF